MLPYKRTVRVGVLIRDEIVKIIRDIADLNAKLLTITEVRLSDDLLNCKIYYSVFGNEEDKKTAEQNLNKHLKEIRYQLAIRVNLRRTPQISFVYDDTNDNADKIFEILKKIEDEKKR
jgi:ribosome-binding factor A